MAVQRPIKSLSELMDGGVEERFNFEMDKIWQNVQDPNTDPKAKREINIKITVRPNERRDSADFDVSVIPKLAPFKPLSKTTASGSEASIFKLTRLTVILLPELTAAAKRALSFSLMRVPSAFAEILRRRGASL